MKEKVEDSYSITAVCPHCSRNVPCGFAVFKTEVSFEGATQDQRIKAHRHSRTKHSSDPKEETACNDEDNDTKNTENTTTPRWRPVTVGHLQKKRRMTVIEILDDEKTKPSQEKKIEHHGVPKAVKTEIHHGSDMDDFESACDM